MLNISIYVQLLYSLRKLICTSLYILLDDLLETAAVEGLFLKSPVMESGQGQAPTKTWEEKWEAFTLQNLQGKENKRH